MSALILSGEDEGRGWGGGEEGWDVVLMPRGPCWSGFCPVRPCCASTAALHLSRAHSWCGLCYSLLNPAFQTCCFPQNFTLVLPVEGWASSSSSRCSRGGTVLTCRAGKFPSRLLGDTKLFWSDCCHSKCLFSNQTKTPAAEKQGQRVFPLGLLCLHVWLGEPFVSFLWF